MKSQILSIVLIMFCSVSMRCYAQEFDKEYIEQLSKADSLQNKGLWTEAEQCLVDLLRQHPSNSTNVLLMSNIGMIRHYAGRDTAALDILDKAVEMAPVAATVRCNRAKVLTSLGKFTQACDDYTRVIERDTTMIEPLYMRCLIGFYVGDTIAVDRDVKLLVRRFPDTREALEATAYRMMSQSKYQEAIPVLNKLILLDRHPSNYGERALCYIMTDQLSEASADLSDAILLDPANGDFYLYRALLNKKRFRPQDAIEDLNKAISLGVSRGKIRQYGL